LSLVFNWFLIFCWYKVLRRIAWLQFYNIGLLIRYSYI